MDFDQADDDCTIYIEELKSDDPNLKINAVSKVNKIAEILGILILPINIFLFFSDSIITI